MFLFWFSLMNEDKDIILNLKYFTVYSKIIVVNFECLVSVLLKFVIIATS